MNISQQSIPNPGESDSEGEVFISYSSLDRQRILEIANQLESAGVRLWLDRSAIGGGMNYGPEIVRGIRNCKVLLLMCSQASMRSRNVKQEIQLAWAFERPYLPLLLDDSVMGSYPEQVLYWLEGSQWIEVLDRPVEEWLPRVIRSLARLGIACNDSSLATEEDAQSVNPIRQDTGLQGLYSIAKYTDQIWPVSADRAAHVSTRSGLRDLGAPQDDVQHAYHLGDYVNIVIESEIGAHLLLLNIGTTGTVYCLCPSQFAPDTHLTPGRTALPLKDSKFPSFVITGKSGREHLLAIITSLLVFFLRQTSKILSVSSAL
jgi:hypothetical protein